QKVPDEEVKKVQLIFAADGKLTLKREDKGDLELTYKLDTTKDPKHITLEGDGKKMVGIYTLDGDELRVCLSEDPDNRPTEFATKAGTKTVFGILKRVKQ